MEESRESSSSQAGSSGERERVLPPSASPPGFLEEEDTMTKKQKRWLALGGAALAVGLLAWAFWPRTFAQTVGEGYDPSQIWEMQVTLNDVADPDRSRSVVLSAGVSGWASRRSSTACWTAGSRR